MRFPSKKLVVRASLLLIFALPTLANAGPPDVDGKVDEAKEAPTAEWRDLSLEQAKGAFGSEFFANNIGGTYTLFGGTSSDCMQHFDIHNDGASGEFWVRYDGLKPDCLNFDTVKAATPAKDFVLLSEKPDSKMTPTGTFTALKFRTANPYSGLNPFDRKDLASSEKDADGKAIVLSHTSEADVRKQKEQDELDKRKAQIETAEKVVSTCKHGISELDIVPSWLSYLASQPEFMKDKKEDWLKKKLKKNRKREFAACKSQIRKGTLDRDKMSDKTIETLSTCDTFLKTLASEDPDSVKKIKKLYTDLINRYLQSAPPGLESEYDAAMDLLAKAREFDLSEDESTDLDNLEQNLNVHFLNAATKDGTDSEEFQAMKSSMLTYMLDQDKAGCLNDDGQLKPFPLRTGKNCASAAHFSTVLNYQLGLANGAQLALNQKAAFEQLNTEVAACSAARATATQSGAMMDPTQDARCKPLEAQLALLEKPATIGSLNNAGAPFGQVSTGNSNTTVPNQASTGQTAVTQQTQTVNVPVTTVQSSGVRLLTRK